MRLDERPGFDHALERTRGAAYGTCGFVGQEGFMRAGDILALAHRAGVASGVSVLDVCCGTAGPGRLITRELGCRYLGVDASAAAIELARGRADTLPCRFEVARVPPLPPGPFDVVLLLETMLAFPDKKSLLEAVVGVLAAGGRFAFTLEEGAPLTEAERARMPHADTVWPTPRHALVAALERLGLRIAWVEECTPTHLAVVEALTEAYTADAAVIAACAGRQRVDELLSAHRLWGEWLARGRIRKYGFVVVKDPAGRGDG